MTVKALQKTFFFVIGSIATSQAIVVANYSGATNDRFPYNSSFIGDSFDLSGVGRATNGTWATAIGANYFISANHFHPTTTTPVTFTKDNMGSPSSYTYAVGGGCRIGTTDLWLGYTVAAIDPTIARYNVTNQSANTLPDLGLGTSTLYMNGDQVPGSPGTVADHVLGTNQAESFYNEGSGQFTTPGVNVVFTPPPGFENDMIILVENLSGDDTPPLTHEAIVQGGDSGSPLFSASGSTLTLLGAGSLLLGGIPGNFIDTPGSFPSMDDPVEERGGSAYSYLGSYETELDACIATVPAPIPEPTTLSLFAFALGFSMRRRR